MIALFTDFGLSGPYMGQMKAVIYQHAPGVEIVDLMADAPAYNPRAAAYLLAAYVRDFPADTVFLCVIDPGVGSQVRQPVVVGVDGWRFVGPDNGLFDVVAARGREVQWWDIAWRPQRLLSATFHGRDLFASVAAGLARGAPLPGVPRDAATAARERLPEDLAEVIYIDHFGNALTGVRAAQVPAQALLHAQGFVLSRARTFSDVPLGGPFWYENANGLVEIAVNQGRADTRLGLRVGTPVSFE